VIREGSDEKDYALEPEENMAKAPELGKQYWKQIGGWAKAKKKTTRKKA